MIFFSRENSKLKDVTQSQQLAGLARNCRSLGGGVHPQQAWGLSAFVRNNKWMAGLRNV